MSSEPPDELRPKPAPRPKHREVEAEPELAPSTPKAAMASWAVGVLRSLTLNNILVLALLAVVALPSYAGYKFLTDPTFRKELFSGGRISLVDATSHCVIYQGSLGGDEERTFVFVGYAFEGRIEHIIGIRTAQIMPLDQVKEICKGVRSDADRAAADWYEKHKPPEDDTK